MDALGKSRRAALRVMLQLHFMTLFALCAFDAPATAADTGAEASAAAAQRLSDRRCCLTGTLLCCNTPSAAARCCTADAVLRGSGLGSAPGRGKR